MSQDPICIVGGGIIGLACAYYLLQAGYQNIKLIEQNQVGQGCSHGNCGLLSLSHLLPLPHPGMISSTLKSLLTKGRLAPVYIPPRFNWRLWHWCWQFAQNCTAQKAYQAVPIRYQLINSSLKLYQQLSDNPDIDYQIHRKGALYVFESAAGMAAFINSHETELYDQYQLNWKKWDGPTLHQLEPNLKANLYSAIQVIDDAHIQPDLFIKAWRRYLAPQIEIHEHCQAIKWIDRYHLMTSQGKIGAKHFVLTTGVYSPTFQKQLGCKLSIQAGKGYSLSFCQKTKPPLSTPLILPERRLAITPMDNLLRIGSTVEFSGINHHINPKRLALLQNGLDQYFEQPITDDRPVEVWCGLRPMTPNDLPYIGHSPAFDNVLIATGHNMNGIAMAPATGQLIAEMIQGIPTHIDTSLLAPS